MGAKEQKDKIASVLAGVGYAGLWAEEIMSALSKAGYRILAPGEVDAETLERAAEVARHVPTPADVQDHMLRLGYISASQAIAAAILSYDEAQQ